MSSFVSRGDTPIKGIKPALVFGVLWLVSIIVMWFAFRSGEGQPGGFLNWIARFHVLVVHFPIGLIFLVILMEVAGFKWKALRESTPFVLWVSFLGSIGATVLGYLLMGTEATAGKAMDLHMYTGLAVVVLSLAALVFRLLSKSLPYALSLILSALGVSAAGHYGGSMIHEADYLSVYGPEPLKPLLLAGLPDPKAGDKTEEELAIEAEAKKEIPMEERLVYTDFVVPMLEAKCNECHNENKIKGKLRMDTHDLLMAGATGSDYPTVEPGNADDSEMIVRVTLPKDDDEFMPPKGDGLTNDEIELLKLWIQGGAKADATVADLGGGEATLATVGAVAAIHGGTDEEVDIWQPVWDGLSPEERQERLDLVTTEAAKLNVSLLR
ncbi:MAG: c-type cytochrome domain-containing protein [Verrucomicrobiota bacterium]